MCETLVKRNIPKEEQPEYVYKVVLKTPCGKYVTPIVGAPIHLHKTQAAKKTPKWRDRTRVVSKVKWFPRWVKKVGNQGSHYSSIHNGKWAVFSSLHQAYFSGLLRNFACTQAGRMEEVILKCVPSGEIHKTKPNLYSRQTTYLCEKLRPVKEVEYSWTH